MKLIDEKEVEECATEWAAGHGVQKDAIKFDFKSGVSFAEQKLQPMMVEFAEWVAKFYTLSKYGEWCSLGMPTTNTTEQLLGQFLKTKQK